MPRIRTVKPELFKHGDLYDAEKRYQLPLRLPFIGIFTLCDREGRFRWKPREMKLDILPYDDLNFEDVLDALSECGFICKYIINGVKYGYIPSWHKHQVINNRESQSTIPPPPESYITSVVDTSTSDESRVIDACTTPLCFAQVEGKGMEVKGKEGTISANTPTQDIEDIFNHWKSVMHKPKAKLDSNRRSKIISALKQGYSVDELKLAIEGCSKSNWHMGKNDQGCKYVDIDLIFRNAEKIEGFITLATNSQSVVTAKKIMDDLATGAI